MNSSIQIGKIMGIPIKLHINILLIIPVFGYIFGNNPPVLALAILNRYGFEHTGVIRSTPAFRMRSTTELGHSYVAKKHGSNIQGITLFLLEGFFAWRYPQKPEIEFKMALAGPAISL